VRLGKNNLINRSHCRNCRLSTKNQGKRYMDVVFVCGTNELLNEGQNKVPPVRSNHAAVGVHSCCGRWAGTYKSSRTNPWPNNRLWLLQPSSQLHKDENAMPCVRRRLTKLLACTYLFCRWKNKSAYPHDNTMLSKTCSLGLSFGVSNLTCKLSMISCLGLVCLSIFFIKKGKKALLHIMHSCFHGPFRSPFPHSPTTANTNRKLQCRIISRHQGVNIFLNSDASAPGHSRKKSITEFL
jgi:hypothetical protein